MFISLDVNAELQTGITSPPLQSQSIPCKIIAINPETKCLRVHLETKIAEPFSHSFKSLRVGKENFKLKDAVKGDSLTAEILELLLDPKESIELFTTPVAQTRKQSHINLCAQTDVESTRKDNGLSKFQLQPQCLPDLNWEDVDPSIQLWGRKFSWPFFITGMTGGVDDATSINFKLAKVAARLNIPMGIGSQRMALEDPKLANVFKVKHKEPDVFLIANLGIAQILQEDSVEKVTAAIDMIQADAIAIHINIMQELVQTEGDRRFKGSWQALKKIKEAISVPLIVKEVGCGIDPLSAERFLSFVDAIDIGGKGGTSWAYIEGMRGLDPRTRQLGEWFRDWGITTGDCLKNLSRISESKVIFATGGIRTPLDICKAVRLGATSCGMGLPFLRAALAGEKALDEWVDTLTYGIQAVYLALGASSTEDLKKVRLITRGDNGL